MSPETVSVSDGIMPAPKDAVSTAGDASITANIIIYSAGAKTTDDEGFEHSCSYIDY